MKTALKTFLLVCLISLFGNTRTNAIETNSSITQSCDTVITDTIVTCFPYFWDVTDTTYYFTGIYSDTFQTSQGCDSIRVLNATIYTSYISTTTAFICQGEQFIWNNQLLFQSGFYDDTLQTVNGCDSVLRLNLNVTPVDTSVQRVGNSLRANLSPAFSYQWFDCDGDVLIPGANGRTYTPSRSGIYKVRVNDFGCIDFSGCYSFVLTELNEEVFEKIRVFPNPASDAIRIDIPEDLDVEQVYLVTTTGSVLNEIKITDFSKPVSLIGIPRGAYFLKFEGKNFSMNLKLIIE